MQSILRSLIKEVLKSSQNEEELDEFSGVASLGGGPSTPLGTGAHYPDEEVSSKKKNKKVQEANTAAGGGLGGALQDYNFDGDGDPDGDNKLKSRDERYKDSVEALARSYGGAKSPFKSIRHARKHLAHKY